MAIPIGTYLCGTDIQVGGGKEGPAGMKFHFMDKKDYYFTWLDGRV